MSSISEHSTVAPHGLVAFLSGTSRVLRIWPQSGSTELFDIADGAPVLTLRTLVHAEDRRELRRAVREWANGSRALAVELRLRARSGAYHPVQVRCVAHADGDDLRIVGTLHAADTTPRAHRAGGPPPALAALVHDLSTPLAALIHASEQLAESTALPASERRHVLLVHEAADCVQSLSRDILHHLKTGETRLPLRHRPFALHELVERCARLSAAQVDLNRVALRHHVEDGVPTCLVGDSARLEQVLLNLASNAARATKAGEVSLAAQLDGYDGEAALIRFTVSDTGLGIPVDEAAHVTTTFFSGRHSRSPERTGLGLSIVEDLVARMGGRLRFTSEPGRGSRFWFTIPLDVVATDLWHPVRPGRILCVEDSSVFRSGIEASLRAQGHQVTGVGTAQEALRTLASQTYDLVLLDLGLPDLDGLSTLRCIRHLHPREQLPVAVLSGTRDLGRFEASFDAGANLFLYKPFDGPTLVRAVETVLACETPSRHADASAPIDMRAVNTLVEVFGGDKSATIADALAHLRGELRVLRIALAKGDVPAIERDAHGVVTTAAAIGLRRVSRLAAVLEQACADADLTIVREIIALVVDAFARDSEWLSQTMAAGAGITVQAPPESALLSLVTTDGPGTTRLGFRVQKP